MLSIVNPPATPYIPDYKLDPPRPKRPVFICSNCGEPIRDGDDYYDILGEQYCAGCIANMKQTAHKEED